MIPAVFRYSDCCNARGCHDVGHDDSIELVYCRHFFAVAHPAWVDIKDMTGL